MDGAPGDSRCCITQCSSNVVTIKWWQFSHDLIRGHSIGQHPENRCNRDSKPPDAWLPAHLAGIYGDAVHVVTIPKGYDN